MIIHGRLGVFFTIIIIIAGVNWASLCTLESNDGFSSPLGILIPASQIIMQTDESPLLHSLGMEKKHEEFFSTSSLPSNVYPETGNLKVWVMPLHLWKIEPLETFFVGFWKVSLKGQHLGLFDLAIKGDWPPELWRRILHDFIFRIREALMHDSHACYVGTFLYAL